MENKDKVQKPASILSVEFRQALINVINNTNLPAFIIEPILKDLYLDIKTAAQRQYEADMVAYERILESEKEQ